MIALLIIIYIIGFIVTYSGSLAYMQGSFKNIAEIEFREQLGGCMFFALLPPAWIIWPFFTGFYKYGFQFTKTLYTRKTY